jgi:hypothetical protein
MYLYPSLYNKDIYRSMVIEATWFSINNNLDNKDFYIIQQNISGKVLYAGTYDGSIKLMRLK